MRGRIESVQVGRAGAVPWRGRSVRTGIVKHPVAGRVHVTKGGVVGDEQADLRVHGGPDKAVCAYPVEHRPLWEEFLETELPHGAFGENLALSGLLESDVHIGDVMRAGGTLLQVSQPRGPCFKLAARWGKRTLPARMAQEQISGFYFRVLEAGALQAGDSVTLEERRSEISVAEVLRVTYVARKDVKAIRRVLEVPEFAQSWASDLRQLSAQEQLPLDDFGV
jgi:MOSC domain-containing protein YiiM